MKLFIYWYILLIFGYLIILHCVSIPLYHAFTSHHAAPLDHGKSLACCACRFDGPQNATEIKRQQRDAGEPQWHREEGDDGLCAQIQDHSGQVGAKVTPFREETFRD